MSGTHNDFLRSCFGLSLNTGIGTSSQLHELFVTALMEHFCQNAFAPREGMAAGSPGLPRLPLHHWQQSTVDHFRLRQPEIEPLQRAHVSTAL